VRHWRRVTRAAALAAAPGALWAVWAVAGMAQRPGPAADGVPLTDVEAAFLLNFTRFVEWPAAAFEDGRSPLTVCVMGNEAVARALGQLAEGESAGGRRIAVRKIDRAPGPKACQVLFIGGADEDISGILSGAGFGVLTVSDRPGFLKEGGIIVFAIEDRHVRFDINRRAAASASLTISSRLLSVARSVR